MKSILVGLLATASSVLAVGCGCGSPTDFAPATLNASSVQAIRTPSACGVADPPYSVTDTFTLTIVGKDSVPTPYNTFTVTLRDTVASPARIPLVVPLPGTGTPATTQTATSSGADITFSFARGPDATEVDDSFLSSVVVDGRRLFPPPTASSSA